mmetsp:Transcript_112049/g.222715  ORF Transcript_112049/g.222715 Transcript_112049/m.222715 type:complete len:247 (-) Transcript_112049:91-831(-)
MARWQRCFFDTCPSLLRERHQDFASFVDIPPANARFHVTVDGFQRGSPVVFRMTVRHGDAVWNIRRRHKQVWEMHSSLLRGLGRSASLTDLPRPPPKATARSLLFGQRDDQFLQERGAQIEQYVNNLLCYIPMVEQCEALYKFLCFTNLRNWEYGEMVSGGAPPVDASAVAKLPRMKELTMDTLCVVCQNKMELGNEAEDVRVLPCGHKFHYACISRWLQERNTCCVCQGAAILTAPRLGWGSGCN